ncbi:MAG: hypothetical protein ACM3OB_02485 [Acidobacteriota bacterium]
MAMLGTVLTVVGSIVMLIFAIQILIMAFKTSVGWGLASLFIPLVIFFYVAKNWAACKTPFLRWVVGLVIMIVGFALSFYGAMSAAPAG